jgi:5-formyltetrahydrofolate cyclo-ligase
MAVDKHALREEVWRAMTVQKAARFPGAQGRIPNFIGAEAAAQHLTTLDEIPVLQQLSQQRRPS